MNNLRSVVADLESLNHRLRMIQQLANKNAIMNQRNSLRNVVVDLENHTIRMIPLRIQAKKKLTQAMKRNGEEDHLKVAQQHISLKG